MLVMYGSGHSLPKWAVSAMSAIAPIATELRTPRHVANVPTTEVSLLFLHAAVLSASQ
jgi:hypothetical protein